MFKSLQKTADPYDSSVLLLIIIPVTSIFIMLTFVGMDDQYTLIPGTNRMISLSSFFLLLMNLLVFGINQYNRKKNLEYTEMQLLLQKETDFTEYYKMLLSQSENQAILIHDIKKHFQSIASLNEQNAPDKVSAYIRELLLSSDFKESAGKVPNSYIEINGSKRENTPFVLITVVNSCRINPFQNDTADPSTTKTYKHSHGFGLKSIRKICEKYHGDMQMYYDDATLTFHTVITLRG